MAMAAAEVAARTGDTEPGRERQPRQTAGEVQGLKARDNVTNWIYLARIYVVIALAIAGAVWVDQAVRAGAIAWWWSIPATLAAIVVIGASQHQFGGVVHEGAHHILFANRTLNELVSDWLAALPILTTTYHYRLHHLAHHQFVNDPDRDPDISQLRESDHWLDFPITHVEMLWAVLKQLWLPNLLRYTRTRARYSSFGGGHNPYSDPAHPGTIRPVRAGILFAVGAPLVVIPMTVMGNWLGVAIALPVMWAAVVTILWRLPDDAYPQMRLAPVLPIRLLGISRVTLTS
jgi:fatty acid desaturase